jgi:hypothetical protein
MEALPKLILLVIGLASVLIATTPADAAKTNKHRHAQTNAVVDNSRYRGANLFPVGPVYNVHPVDAQARSERPLRR